MNNLYLVGMPGCGKTSVAAAAERRFGRKVRDTDALVVAEHGEIDAIFASFGEERFRAWETEAVKQVCAEEGVVVATGGGCALREENVKRMKESGSIVYLRTALKTLEERMKDDASRPLLRGGFAERLARLYRERTPVYERVADLVVDTDGFSPEEICKKILSAFGG